MILDHLLRLLDDRSSGEREGGRGCACKISVLCVFGCLLDLVLKWGIRATVLEQLQQALV